MRRDATSKRGAAVVLVLLALLTPSLQGCGQRAPHTVRFIWNTGVEIDGEPIPIPSTLARFQKVVGAPSRIIQPEGLPNTIFVWDELGFSAHAVNSLHGYHDSLFIFSVHFVAGTHEMQPRVPFKGAVKVDDVILTAESTLKDWTAAGFEKRERKQIWHKRKGRNILTLHGDDKVLSSIAHIQYE